jgi:transcriptional antiterminator NusG
MSNWYAVQCVSGKEEAARRCLLNLFKNYKTFYPKRELEIRKDGKVTKQIKALFPGYFFLQSGSRMMYYEAIEMVKNINGMFSGVTLLKVVGMTKDKNSCGSDEITPIRDQEIDLFLEITNQEEVVEFSTYKKTGDKIKIISGPLTGLEGIIIKLNARKKRVKVGVELLGQMQIIDLGAEMVA